MGIPPPHRREKPLPGCPRPILGAMPVAADVVSPHGGQAATVDRS